MILWWIERAGPRPYLLKLKQSYDHGYNHGDLTEVADSDKAELRDLVHLMLELGYENMLGRDASFAAQIRAQIGALWTLLNADLENTQFYVRRD